MKKIILSLTFITLISGYAESQITLDSTNFATIGWVVQEARDSLPTVAPGNSGANQTWDLSGLDTHTVDTLTFTNPNWTQGGTDFPDANLAIYNHGDSMHTYINNSYSGAEMLGIGGDVFGAGYTTIKFDPTQTFTQWPMNYQDSFNDSSGIDETFYLGQGPTGPDSARFKQLNETFVDVDGWGSVTTPLGTFDALRTYTITINTDSIWIWTSFSGWTFYQEQTGTTYQYEWFSNDPNTNFPIATMTVDAGNNAENVRWLLVTPTLSGIDDNTTSDLKLYPNPAQEQLTIETQTAGILEIINVNGQLVKRIQLQANLNTVEVKDLDAGVYIYVVTSQNNDEIKTGQFTISR
ncbi:MAG: T9SS type A sorting domain-containing protein [Crocinitomicaceae bacterium]|nr:T9SS type A sorting domain-containing protein [Crocinitomicaceae bacterium]